MKKYTTILLVTILVLVIVPTHVYAGGTIDFNEYNIEVPEHMIACETDADCLYVDKDCGDCCKYVPINKDYVVEYRKMKTNSCNDKYKGKRREMCDCIAPVPEMECKNSKCILSDSTQ